MSNGRNLGRRLDKGRDSGGFVALPWSVLDCPAYKDLRYSARALLLEIARQFAGDNNGRLLASRAYLAPRGWNSADVIHSAKNELLQAGFIHETVKGHRPNKAGWYAVTWRALDRHPGYDPGAVEGFVRGAYRLTSQPKNAPHSPKTGQVKAHIGPDSGLGGAGTCPENGTVRPTNPGSSGPVGGHHLEKPSAGAVRQHPEPLEAP